MEENINSFQKYLSLWVVLCMAGGILIGKFLPAIPQLLNQFEYANVSIPIAIFIWVMIYPMVMKVDFNSIKNIGKILVDLGYQLVDQAIYHVCDCFIIFLCGIQNLDSHGISERISCRCGTSRCCTLHSNGVCLEFSYQRKSCIYSSTGCHK